MEGIENEIHEIKSVLRYYIKSVEQMRRIDIPLIDNLNQIECSLYYLHGEMLDISRTLILLNDIKKYRSSSLFIKTLIEVFIHMAFIDQNPSELNKYHEVQSKGFELINDIDFSQYFKTPFNRSDFKEIIKYSYIKNSSIVHPIILDKHEYSYDLKTSLEELKMTLDLFHLSTKIFRKYIDRYLLDSTNEKLEILRLETIRIIQPIEFEKNIDNIMSNYDDAQDLSIKEKETLIDNIQLIKSGNIIRSEDLSDIEAHQLLFRNLNYIKNNERLSDLTTLSFSLKGYFEDLMIKSDNDKFFNILKKLTYDSLILMETIIYLNTLRRYNEVNVVHRTIFENSLLVEYFHIFPEEIERWLDIQGNLVESLFDGDDSKAGDSKRSEYSTLDKGWIRDYREMDYFDFCSFLEKNRYGYLLKQISKDDYQYAKFFEPEYIIKNLKNRGKKPEENLYSELSNYVKPNLDIAKKPSMVRDLDYEIQKLTKCFIHISKHLDIILSEYYEYIPTYEELEVKVEMIKNLS